MHPRRILCAVDFSEPSREALHYAADLARQFGAHLTLLHVFQVPAYTFPEGAVLAGPDVLSELLDRIEQSLAEWRGEAQVRGAADVEARSVEGSPGPEIVRHAAEEKHDLIVVGTHGRTGLRHALLGSVAEKVVRTAPCPVLAVRPTDHKFEQPTP